MRFNKYNLVSWFMFFFSPILALPLFIVNLKSKTDRSIIFFISVYMALFSFHYIPHFNDDKVRYVERFKLFSNYAWEDFVFFLSETMKPDFLFDYFNYLFSVLNIDVKFYFFSLTFFTIYSIFLFVKKTVHICGQEHFKYTTITFFLVLLSVSIPGIFSGFRFYFACGFFIWAIYFLLFNVSRIKGLFFLILAISTHFSFLYLSGAIFLAYLKPRGTILKIGLIFSLVFYLFPLSFLSYALNTLQFSESYMYKINAYSASDYEISFGYMILNYIRNLWLYLSIFYFLFFVKDTRNFLFIFSCVLLIFINITSSSTMVFNRYAGFYNIIFSSYLIYSFLFNKIKKSWFYVFFIFIAIGRIVDLFLLKSNIYESLSDFVFYTFVHLLYDFQPGQKFL